MRFINNDPSLPKLCNSKWFYNDIRNKCDCIDTCKFSHLKTRKQWIEYANNEYGIQIKKFQSK